MNPPACYMSEAFTCEFCTEMRIASLNPVVVLQLTALKFSLGHKMECQHLG